MQQLQTISNKYIMSTNQKPSTRGKKNRMWGKVPSYMKEKFRGEISDLHEMNLFWILVFTVSEEEYKKMPEGKKWDSQVWIWNTDTEAWESKTVFGTLGDEHNKNSWVDHYFYHHEHQRLIVTGKEFHCVAVYSFQGELIGEYHLTYPENLERIFWKMPDKDTLYIAMNPSKTIEKIDLAEKKKYSYSFTDNLPVKDIVFYPQAVTEKLHIMVVESVYDNQVMLRIIFANYTATIDERSDNAYRPEYKCIRFRSKHQVWLPKRLFGDITSKLKWDSQQFNIPGLDIIPFADVEKI